MEGYCSAGQSPQWAVVPMEKRRRIILNIANLYRGYNATPRNVPVTDEEIKLKILRTTQQIQL
jgi:hypothetical protein